MKEQPEPRSIPAPPGEPDVKLLSWLDRGRLPVLILLYVLLALNFMRLPKAASDVTHDSGSHMSFEFYARAKYQWGVDVIQNVGPYGYLSYPYDYSGILPAQKLMFGIIFGLALAWYVLDARRYFSAPTVKGVWLVASFFALVHPEEDLDPLNYLFILLAAHHLLLPGHERPGRWVSDAVLCVLLGLFCLMKSTNVMLVGLLMLLLIYERVRTRRYSELAWNVGCVGLTVCFLWIHAGQKLSNAIEFMRGAMAFSKGYNEALAYAGRPDMVWLGLAVITLFAATNALRLWQFRAYRKRLPVSVFEAACVFLVWKHGYLRAGHEVTFWSFIIASAPLLFLAHEPSAAEQSARIPARTVGWRASLATINVSMDRLAAVPMTLTFICAIWACRIERGNSSYSGYATPVAAIEGPFKRIASNLGELADWPGHRRALEASLEHNRADAALPAVKKAIGDATVDEFGFLPGAILLNGFHYTPRPMPINFGATTEKLMTRNAEFYRDDVTAPAFLVANIGQADGRFAPQDDALALLEVLGRYRPQLADHGFFLLKRVPDQPNLERVLLETRTIKWGESVPVPSTSSNLLWCAADIRLSLRGQARSVLYQPPQLFIVLESPGRRMEPIRLLRSGAGTGFLLRPTILNGADFLEAFGIHVKTDTPPTPAFDSLRLMAGDPDCFLPEIKLSFSIIEAKR